MHCHETSFGYLLALAPGDELIASLIGFARHHDVDGAVLQGLGSVRRLELGHYDPDRGAYDRQIIHDVLEVCGITGNIALLDGEPYAHVHGTFSRADATVIGGHVFSAICAAALEVAVHTASVPLVRGAVESGEIKRLIP